MVLHGFLLERLLRIATFFWGGGGVNKCETPPCLKWHSGTYYGFYQSFKQSLLSLLSGHPLGIRGEQGCSVFTEKSNREGGREGEKETFPFVFTLSNLEIVSGKKKAYTQLWLQRKNLEGMFFVNPGRCERGTIFYGKNY